LRQFGLAFLDMNENLEDFWLDFAKEKLIFKKQNGGYFDKNLNFSDLVGSNCIKFEAVRCLPLFSSDIEQNLENI